MPAGSESIFSASKPKEDVRHDLDAVQKCWSQEKARRFKRAIVIVIPLLALPVIGYVILAKCNPNYSLSRISDPPLPESAYEAYDESAPKPEAPVFLPKGNPIAKLRIELYPELADKNLLELLYTAVEAKPSEIYLDMLDKKTLDAEELMRLRGLGTCGLKVGGKDMYTLQFGDKTKNVDFNTPFDLAYTPEDLAMVITVEHEKCYGTPKTPIFMKIKEIKQNVLASIVPEEPPKEKQSFDFLQTPQETNKSGN